MRLILLIEDDSTGLSFVFDVVEFRGCPKCAWICVMFSIRKRARQYKREGILNRITWVFES